MRPGLRIAAIGTVSLAALALVVFSRRFSSSDDTLPDRRDIEIAAETSVQTLARDSTDAIDRSMTDRRIEVFVTIEGIPANAEVVLIDWNPAVVEEARSLWGLRPETKETSLRRFATGDEGRLLINAPHIPFVIGARAKGCQATAIEVTSHVDRVELELDPGARIMGTIYDEMEQPISAVAVRIQFDVYNDYSLATPFPPHVRAVAAEFVDDVETGIDGKFEFDSLVNGAFCQLSASALGYVDCVVPRIRVPFPDSAAVVLMRGTAAVRGRVIDEMTREGLPNARVALTQRLGSSILGVPSVTSTDVAGKFMMPRVASRATVSMVDVDAPGYGHNRVRLTKLQEGSVAEIEIPVRKTATFHGIVIPLGGADLRDLEAWGMMWAQDAPYEVVPVAADGSFTLTRVPGETPFVVIITRNRDTLDKAVALTPWQQPFEIFLHPRKGLSGRLIAESYPLPSGSMVRLASEGNRPGLVTERFIEPNLATGEFVIPDQLGGTYFFDAFVSGYAVERIAHIVHDPNDRQQPPLQVKLQRGAELVGTIRDSATGRAIEGAVVELADMSPMGWDTLYGHYLESCRVESDAEGNYRFSNVDPEQPVALIVSASGFGKRQIRHVAGPHERSIRLDIPLDPAARVTVRAIRPDGAPATSFGFEARCEDRLTRSEETENGTLEMRDLIAGVVKGSVRLLDVDLGDAFGTSAWQSFEIRPGESKELLFDFSRGATIRGQVRSKYYDHIPNSQTIIVRRSEEDGFGETSSNVRLPNQRYAVYGIPPGKVRVELSTIAPGPDTASERILDVEDGKTYEVDFEVSGASLRGVVRDSVGAPVAGAEVRMRRVGSREIDGVVDAVVDGWHLDTSKADGSIELIGLLDGRQEFEVRAEGYGRLEGEYDFVASRSEDEWAIRLEREAVLTVRATDRAGEIVEGVRVRIRAVASRNPSLRAPSSTEHERFEFRGLGTGNHVVTAEAPGWFSAEIVVPVVAGSKSEATITLRRPSVLWLKLLGPNGELLTRSSCSIIDLETKTNIADWCADGRVRVEPVDLATNEKGEIRFDGLPEGQYRVVAAGIDETVAVTVDPVEKPRTLQAVR